MDDKEIIEKELAGLISKFELHKAFAIRSYTVVFLEDYLRFHLVKKYEKDFNFRLLVNNKTKSIDVDMNGWLDAGYSDIDSIEYKGKDYLVYPVAK